MVSTVASDFRQWHTDIPPGSAAVLAPQVLAGGRNPFDDWQTYEQQLSSRGGLMPLGAVLHFTGLVTDGGAACAGPVGDNFMLETEIGTLSQQALQAVVTQRMNRMTPAEQMEMARMMRSPGALPAGADPVAADIAQQSLGFPITALPPSVMADLEGSTMLEVFSPNAVSWIAGSLPRISGDGVVFEHGGVGGWAANSAAEMWIVIPNVRVSDLTVGEDYPAIAPAVGGKAIFYVKSNGTWQHRDLRTAKCSWKNPVDGWQAVGPPDPDFKSKFRDAFSGTITTAQHSGLTGTVKIVDLSGGMIKADFRLSGPATLLEEQYDYVFSDNLQDICEFGSSQKLVRGALNRRSEQPYTVTVIGQAIAPASVVVTRPGRRIAQTRAIGGPTAVAAQTTPSSTSPPPGTPPGNTPNPGSTSPPPAQPPPAPSPQPVTPGPTGAPTTSGPTGTPAPSSTTTSGPAGAPAPSNPTTRAGGQPGAMCSYSVTIAGRTLNGSPGDRISFVTAGSESQLMISTTTGGMFGLEFAALPPAGKTGPAGIKSSGGTLGVPQGESYEGGSGSLTITANAASSFAVQGQVKVQRQDQRGRKRGTETLNVNVRADASAMAGMPAMPPGMGAGAPIMCVVN